MWMSVAVWLLTASLGVSALGFRHERQVFPGIGSFQFNEELLNWSDAYTHCKELGGYLAVAESVAEANVLQQIMAENEVESVHIGVSDQHVEGAYYTILGKPVGIDCASVWAPGAPIGGETNNCGSLTNAGLTDANCSTVQPSICVLHMWESFGYEVVGGLGWYKHHTNKTSWAGAWEVCRDEGAHLVILNSWEELDALHDRFGFTWVWVGAHHRHANRQFVTIYNQPLETTGFLEWRAGDPAGTNVDHPYVAAQTKDGLYTSRGDASREFVCEHEFTA